MFRVRNFQDPLQTRKANTQFISIFLTGMAAPLTLNVFDILL